MKLSAEETSKYNKYIDNFHYKAGILENNNFLLKKKLNEREKETKTIIARNFKNLGIEIEKISQATGLTKEEIENL